MKYRSIFFSYILIHLTVSVFSQTEPVDLSKLEKVEFKLLKMLDKPFSWNNINPNDWTKLIYDPTVDLEKLEALHQVYWKNKNKVKGTGYNPSRRMIERRKSISPKYYQDPTLRARQINVLKKKKASQSMPSWIPLGPFEEPIGNNGVGRINVIAFHPTDTLKLWAGSPTGGLWTTEDGGGHWFQREGHDQIGSVSDIAVNHNDPNIMYLATGDRDGWDVTSYGLLKSIDGGISWSLTNLIPNTANIPLFFLMDRILIYPPDPEVIIVSTYNGVLKSTNGGEDWEVVLEEIRLRDLVFHPSDPSIIYGTSYHHSESIQFYKSINAGQTWDLIALPNVTDNPPMTIERIAIGVTEHDPNRVVLGVSYGSKADVFVSNNSGLTFETLMDQNDNIKLYGGQSWFNWVIAINPADSNEVFIGGVGLRESSNQGVNWNYSGSGNYSGEYHSSSHVDNHYIGYQPITNTLWCANDGGIMKRDRNVGWRPMNKGLRVTQYYGLSVAQTYGDMILGGAQDNGSHMYVDGDWRFVTGADGQIPLFNQSDHSKLFTSAQNGFIYKSKDVGNSFEISFNPSDYGVRGLWTTPIQSDNFNPNDIYILIDGIYKSSDFGLSWEKMASAPEGINLRALRQFSIAPSDSNRIYLFESYYDIYVSDDKGQTWDTKFYNRLNVPNDLIVHNSNPDIIWVVSRYGVHKSKDAGDTWEDMNNGIENLSAHSILSVGDCCDSLYIGTENGVYSSYNEGMSWSVLGTDLPFSPVYDLDYQHAGNKIYSATYGAGIWSYSLGEKKEAGDCSTLESNILDIISIDTSIVTSHPTINLISSLIDSSSTIFQATKEVNFHAASAVDVGSILDVYLDNCYHNNYVLPIPINNSNHFVEYEVIGDSIRFHIECLKDTTYFEEDGTTDQLTAVIDYNQNGRIDEEVDFIISQTTQSDYPSISHLISLSNIYPIWTNGEHFFEGSKQFATPHLQYEWTMPVSEIAKNNEIHISFHFRNDNKDYNYPILSNTYAQYRFPLKIHIDIEP